MGDEVLDDLQQSSTFHWVPSHGTILPSFIFFYLAGRLMAWEASQLQHACIAYKGVTHAIPPLFLSSPL